MKTCLHPLLAAALLLVQACSTPSSATTTKRAEATPLSALEASRDLPYGVPDLGDVALTVRLSMAAVEWSQLSDDQLLTWARIWTAARAEEDRPYVEYEAVDADGSLRRLNLFDRSPRDGFCVGVALEHEEPARSARIRGFLDSVPQE